MAFHITALYAGLMGLLYFVISLWVVKGRTQYKVNLGDGGHQPLLMRIRSHANFAEYVPLTIVLLGLLELGGAANWLVHGLFLVLLLSRIAHPFGMAAPPGSNTQKALRGLGVLGTWLVLVVASGTLLWRGLMP